LSLEPLEGLSAPKKQPADADLIHLESSI